MLATKCFIYLCVTYCQELVAKPNGQYMYTQPVPVYVDRKCMQTELEGEMSVE